MRGNEGGFTIVEMLVAVVVLSIGITALAGSSGMVTRMVGRGKVTTYAAQIASQRLDLLRAAAASTAPRCTAAAFSSSGAPMVYPEPINVTERWTVSAPSATRTATVFVSYQTVKGVRTDTVSTLVSCF